MQGLCDSRYGLADIPPVHPGDVFYEGVYKYHGTAQVCPGERAPVLYMCGVRKKHTAGQACGYRWQQNAIVCLYTMMYHGVGVRGRCPGWAHGTYGRYDADKPAMKAEGQARLALPGNLRCPFYGLMHVRYRVQGAQGPRG